MKFSRRILCMLVALCTVLSVMTVPSGAASLEDYSHYGPSSGVLAFDSASVVSKFVRSSNGVNYSYDEEENALKVEVTGSDPFVYIEWYTTVTTKVSADKTNYVYTVYKAPRSNSATARSTSTELYLCSDRCASAAERCVKRHSIISQDGYVVSRTDVYGLQYYSNFGGNVRGVRFDVFQNAQVGDVMYIDSVIVNTPAIDSDGAVLAGLRAQAKNGYPVDPSTDLLAASYDVSKYTSPFWKGNIVYNEAVSPIQNSDGSYTYKLMYEPDEVIAVYDGGCLVYYEEGVDYEVNGDELTVLSGGAIDTFLLSDIQNWNYDGDRVFFQSYLNVTYTHSDTWDYYLPESKADQLPNTSSAIINNEEYNVVFFGDSLTGGAKSSSYRGYYPYAPYWWEMIEDALRENYGFTNLNVYDISEGGSTASGMISTFNSGVLGYDPDLIFIEFGVNDAQNGETSGYRSAIETMIKNAKAQYPDCEIVLVSPFYSNTNVYSDYGFEVCRQACLELEEEYDGVVCADITALHKSLREVKRHYDITGDNVCPPNDYFSRIYAQLCLETIVPASLGYEGYVPEGKPVLDDITVMLPEGGLAPIELGGKLDLSKLSLKLSYDKEEANTTVAIDPSWVSGFDPNTVGEQQVKVTYEDFYTYFTVTVYDPVMPGDIDGDKDVTMLDLYMMRLFLKQSDIPDENETRAADIDGDGDVTMLDSYALKYYIANGEWK